MNQRLNGYINTAIKLAKKGKLLQAKKLLLQQYKKYPSYGPVLNQLSIISFQQREYIEANMYCLELLKKHPDNGEIRNRLGQIQMILGDMKNAEDSFRKAIDSNPGVAIPHYFLGKLYLQIGKYSDGLKELELAIHHDPKKVEPYILASKFYQAKRDLDNSKSILERGFKMLPQNKKLILELTKILFQVRDFQSIEGLYLDQLSRDPKNEEVILNMGLLCNMLGKKEVANEWFFKCIDGNSAIAPMATLQYAYNSIFLCQWGSYDWIVERVKKATKRYLRDNQANYDLPVYILMHFDIPRQLYFQAAKKVSYNTKNRIKKIEFSYQRKNKKPTRKIRLGYISSKFRKQAGGLLYYDIFRHHNREEFKVSVYSLIHKEDFISDHIKKSCDHFHNCEHMPSDEIAAKINDDEIDILVTTAGYYDDMRMDILAYQPAPVQVLAQGYNESTGSDFIQYAIVDKNIITDETTSVYSEKLIVLSDCAMINSPLPSFSSKTRKDFNLPLDSFVYASFNQPLKITQDIIALWSKILLQTTSSIFWIYDSDSETARQNIMNEFKDHEIDPSRIYFTGKMNMEEHWGRYRLANLYLDCFNYNAQATAIEALRNGLPILTLTGKTHNSRYASSILKNAGLDNFICSTKSEYVNKAVYYFKNQVELENISKALLENVDIPLFDTQTKVKKWERAFLKIWQNYCDKKPVENLLIH